MYKVSIKYFYDHISGLNFWDRFHDVWKESLRNYFCTDREVQEDNEGLELD